MEAIDRLGWASGTSVEAYGVRLGIRVNDAAALPLVSSRLPPGSRKCRNGTVDALFSLWVGSSPRPGLRRYHILYSGAARRARTLRLDEALDTLEADLRLNVAAASRRRIFVHAGVVVHRGRALLLPGRSGAGKSTLVAALVRRGARYYSDEFALLDREGRVHPFAKPLSIRRDERRAERVAVESLGGRAGHRRARVAAIAFVAYEAAARWAPRRIRPGQALLALIEHTVPVRARPAACLEALERTVAGAVAFKTARGEAENAAGRLFELLEAGWDTLPSGRVRERG